MCVYACVHILASKLKTQLNTKFKCDALCWFVSKSVTHISSLQELKKASMDRLAAGAWAKQG